MAADSSASDLIRGIASECGVDFDEVSWACRLKQGFDVRACCYFVTNWFICLIQDPDAVVIDHVGYAVSETDGEHTLIAADDLIQSDVILGDKRIEVSFLSTRSYQFSPNPSCVNILDSIFAPLKH